MSTINPTVQARTILAIFPHIDKYCERVDQNIRFNAINSYHLPTQDTYEVMQRIINRTYKAQVLHNLKIKVQKRLALGDEKITRVIDLYFLQGKKPAQMAIELGVSERTVFRSINQAVEWFAGRLESMGVTTYVFNELLREYAWIRNMYAEMFLKD